jgi:adenylate cyclase
MNDHKAGAQAAILFADISGSTQIYVQLGDTTAQSVIARALGCLSGVVKEFGGTVVKTIGDEIMCHFASPDAAFDAAVEMQRRLREQASQITDKTRLGIRVGLQWGEAVEQGGDYFGDAVNVAARVAAVAKRDQIVTTEQTVNELDDTRRNLARAFDRVALKGRVGEVVLCLINWDEESDATRMRTVMPTGTVPGAGKSLVLLYKDQHLHLFTEGKSLTMGRSSDCSLVDEASGFASRIHGNVLMRRGRFVIVDQSTNGTYIVPGGLDSGSAEVFIKREEFLLPESGVFSLGQSCRAKDAHLIEFRVEASAGKQ